MAASLLLASALAPAQTVTYFHNDVSGTPVMATDANGDVVWKENYRPYGERLNNPAAEANNKIGFAGKPFDPATGLSYMGARYYDPVVGRFLGVDQAPPDLDNLHSFGRYVYANNNPYKYVDPDGKSALLLLEVGGVMAIGAVFYAMQPPESREAMAATLRRAFGNIFSSSSAQAPPPAPPASADEKPSLLDPKGEQHVLDGDATGGGHRSGTGKPGKSEFPSTWSDEKIKGEISDVATDPKVQWSKPDKRGYVTGSGTRDGVDIKVVKDQKNDRIVSGYPTNVPRNP